MMMMMITRHVYKWTLMLHTIRVHAVTPCNLIGIRYLYLHWVQDSNSRHITFNRRSVRRNMDKLGLILTRKYRGADKSLARPERKPATATEDFGIHISYLLSQLELYYYCLYI